MVWCVREWELVSLEEWLQDKGLVSAIRTLEVCRVSHELPGLRLPPGLVVWHGCRIRRDGANRGRDWLTFQSSEGPDRIVGDLEVTAADFKGETDL